jgi:DNA adenine methylase
LIEAIELTPFSRLEHKRAHDRNVDEPIERARRFYVRSRQSFGSGEGEYSSGWRFQANSRRGTSVIDEWSNVDHLYAAAARLKQAQIECDDALKCIQRFDTPDTLFYVDPPYVWDTRHDTEHMYAHEMTDDQHVQLAALLNRVQGMVILSGYASELYTGLYPNWRFVTKDTKTNANHPAVEYLWISPNAQKLENLPLFQFAEGGK